MKKITEFKKLLSTEKLYDDACSKMNEKALISLKDVRISLMNLGDYKDSAQQLQECIGQIEAILGAQRRSADELLATVSPQSLTDAARLYDNLTVWDYDKNRIQLYKEKISKINQLQALLTELDKLKAEHAQLGGFFKKKARLEVEAKMQNVEKQIAELHNALK